MNLVNGHSELVGRVINLTRTKSNKVRRVHINDALGGILERAMAKSPGRYVFTNSKGTPYTLDGFRTMFHRAKKKAAIEDFRFHDTRHSTATRLRQDGVGIDVIAEVLGHSTLQMAKRYTHIKADKMKEAMAGLPPPAEPKSEPNDQPLSTAKKSADVSHES